MLHRNSSPSQGTWYVILTVVKYRLVTGKHVH